MFVLYIKYNRYRRNYQGNDAIAKHPKYNNLTEKALAKYQYVYDVANRMRCNRRCLELSDFINNDDDFVLYGNSVNGRLLESLLYFICEILRVNLNKYKDAVLMCCESVFFVQNISVFFVN